MSYYDHEAIRKAYPDVVYIQDDLGAFTDFPYDDTNKKTLVQSDIDAARATLDSDYAKVKYQDDRRKEYPDWSTQLDYIYHNGIDKWKTDVVDPVKKKYPKPS